MKYKGHLYLEKNKVGGLTLTNFIVSLYYEATIVKIGSDIGEKIL